MTISEAIKFLQKHQEKYGPDIEVYFDCPECKKSFTPDKLEANTIHISGRK